jgi:hypothetical protein
VKKTLEQELKEVRALAEPGGQLALDRLLMLARASHEFHCTALNCIEMLLEAPSNEEFRQFARKLAAESRELISHSLGRPVQAP